jgi:hypothetical protein
MVRFYMSYTRSDGKVEKQLCIGAADQELSWYLNNFAEQLRKDLKELKFSYKKPGIQGPGCELSETSKVGEIGNGDCIQVQDAVGS